MILEIYYKIVVLVLAVLFFGLRNRFISHFKYSKRMFVRLLFVLLILGLYFTSFTSFANMNIQDSVRIFDGGLLILFGFGIFYFSHRALGKNWT